MELSGMRNLFYYSYPETLLVPFNYPRSRVLFSDACGIYFIRGISYNLHLQLTLIVRTLQSLLYAAKVQDANNG